MPMVKNSLCRLALEHDLPQYFAFQPVFFGPTALMHGNCEEHLLEDLKTCLAAKADHDITFNMAGLVDGTVVDHEQFKAFEGVISMLHLRSELINLLQQPAHNIIRVMQHPLHGLVKTLDFKVKQAEEAEPADAPKGE